MFWRSKTTLKDIIPNGYVDIHSHLLFGIDDGCKTGSDSIYLVNELCKLGFSEFITTPHTTQYVWDNSKASIEDAHLQCVSLLHANNLTMPFSVASEYMMDENFLKLLKRGDILPLDGNMILVEMSYLNPPINLFETLFEIQLAGYVPVLAHPERYGFYHKQPQQYQKLKSHGCLFQLNMLSATGYYGKGVNEAANWLLKHGLIDFTGSDVHHENHLKALSGKLLTKEVDTLIEKMENNKKFSANK